MRQLPPHVICRLLSPSRKEQTSCYVFCLQDVRPRRGSNTGSAIPICVRTASERFPYPHNSRCGRMVLVCAARVGQRPSRRPSVELSVRLPFPLCGVVIPSDDEGEVRATRRICCANQHSQRAMCSSQPTGVCVRAIDLSRLSRRRSAGHDWRALPQAGDARGGPFCRSASTVRRSLASGCGPPAPTDEKTTHRESVALRSGSWTTTLIPHHQDK